MRKIVITGGSGFVGKHLQRELAVAWPEAKVTIWDRIPKTISTCHVEMVDIRRPETYRESLKKIKPEWLVHLAAFSAPSKSFENQELVREINVEATRRLLKEVTDVSPDTKILVTSSADIYGAAEATLQGKPVKELELDEARPRNPYAESKLEMERMIEADYNDQVIRVRPFPHIGPGQGKGFVTADFASQIAEIENGKLESVMKVGNLEAKRDFTDARDVVRAYRMLMEKGKLGEVYHVASGRGTAIGEIMEKLLQEARVEIKVKQDPEKMRPSDVPVLVGDAEKLKKATAWEPKISLDESLKDILNWWRSYRED
jgi:GDP-4-dehydro-6-deoxy-D-mannose reductase